MVQVTRYACDWMHSKDLNGSMEILKYPEDFKKLLKKNIRVRIGSCRNFKKINK